MGVEFGKGDAVLRLSDGSGVLRIDQKGRNAVLVSNGRGKLSRKGVKKIIEWGVVTDTCCRYGMVILELVSSFTMGLYRPRGAQSICL